MGIAQMEKDIDISDYTPAKINGWKSGKHYVLSTNFDDFYKSLWEFNNDLYSN
jgi:hypothetical protein